MSNTMLTDAEYQSLAKIILYKNCTLDVANSIYNDPIKFGKVVSSLMIADWQWNGTGTVYGYRKQMVKWCVENILKQNQRLKNKNLSISSEFDPITEKNEKVVDDLENDDYNNYIKEKIISSEKLSDIEKTVLVYKILEDKTNKEISRELNKTVEGIRQTFKRAVKKLGTSLCV